MKAVVRRILRNVRNVGLAVIWVASLTGTAAAQSAFRHSVEVVGKPQWQRVIDCYNSGAVTMWLMRRCMSMPVDAEEFADCVTGGTCLGKPGRPMPERPPGHIAECGPSRPGNLQTSRGGITSTPLVTGGGITTGGNSTSAEEESAEIWVCLPGKSPEHYLYGRQSEWEPGVVVALASDDPSFNAISPGGGGKVTFALPAIPLTSALQQCRAASSSDLSFKACMVERALPSSYRLTRDCMARHSGNFLEGFLCSAGKQDSIAEVRQAQEVGSCLQKSTSAESIAGCLGKGSLGIRERQWLNCYSGNRGNTAAIALCGLGDSLTPEQKIAALCAVKTGGEPHAFAACTGGELLTREISKCWSGGIGTPNGCLGPNNELYRYWNGVDGVLRNALGANNDAYRAFRYFKDNLLTPSASHDFVRAANTVLNDLRNGPGPNNDLVKAYNAIGRGLQSIGTIRLPKLF